MQKLDDIKTKYRAAAILLRQLVLTDFKLRYQGSILGYLWSLLRPLLLFIILYVVFAVALRFGGDIPNFPILLLLGIVLWSFFSEMTSMSLGSIVSRGELIKKIRIPRWIIVASSSISALINLGLNLMIVFVFMIVLRIDVSISVLWFPLILIQLYLFCVGVSLFLAASFVKYRDVSYIWEVVLQAGFYASPIIYPLTKITSPVIQKIMLLNPVASSVQDARYVLVSQDTQTIASVYGSPFYRIIPALMIVAILVLGLLYFKRQAKDFAENL